MTSRGMDSMLGSHDPLTSVATKPWNMPTEAFEFHLSTRILVKGRIPTRIERELDHHKNLAIVKSVSKIGDSDTVKITSLVAVNRGAFEYKRADWS